MLGNSLNIGSLVGGDKPVVLSAEARERHLYISGGTGVGKSKFLEDCIQQDILSWRDHHCGLILFDPHGLVYQNTMKWLARHELPSRRIIPIDLRRDDWIISYNLLRKRKGGDTAVVVGIFVRALAHVWGQGGTDPTPLFARWATVLLFTLYESGHTIADLPYLLTRDDIRQAMIARVTDQNVLQAWDFAKRNPKEFLQQITSTLNRFQRMAGPKVMQAIFGQPDVSLDLLESLNKGDIILVNLSTEGGMIDEEDSDTFATIVLSDLWAAAKARGKQERETMRPFYVYIDECQKFITPTIAENLDQSRGFGLHLTLANQFPRQFVNAGSHGQAMYDSVMANAGNKIVFKQEHPEDAKVLGEWLFMNTFDTDEVKHEIWSTKVIGTIEKLRQSVTLSEARTHATGSGEGGGQFHGQSLGDGAGGAESFDADNEAVSHATAWNKSFTDSSGESKSWSSSESEANTTGKSVTTSTVDVSVFGKELSSRQYRSIDEQIFRAMQKLFDQKDRHYAIRFHGGPKVPLFVRTPTVPIVPTRLEQAEEYRQRLLGKLPFAIRMIDAQKRMDGREHQLLTDLVHAGSDEPESTGRRIK